MTTIYYTGNSVAVAQVNTLDVTAYDVNTTYNITINSKTVAVPGDTSADQTATDAAADLTASPITEFQEFTWSNPGANASSPLVIATATQAGRPGTISNGTSGGSGTLSSSITVANAGPNVVDQASNWSTGSLPTNGSTVIVQGSVPSLLYDLTGLSGVRPAALNILNNFSGQIGLPYTNSASNQGGGYIEYRPLSLQLPSTTIDIGAGPGNGSTRINLDNLTVQTALTVWNTGTPATGQHAVNFAGTNVNNVVSVLQGDVGLGTLPGTSAVAATLNLLNPANANIASNVEIGTTSIVAAINQEGGTLLAPVFSLSNSPCSAVVTGGTLTIYGDSAVALNSLTVGNRGQSLGQAVVVFQCPGATLASGPLVVYPSGKLDFSQDPRRKDLGGMAIHLSAGSFFWDPNATAHNCTVTEVDGDQTTTINRGRTGDAITM